MYSKFYTSLFYSKILQKEQSSYFISKYNGLGDDEWALLLTGGGKLRFSLTDKSAGEGPNIDSASVFPLNEWVFVGVTYDGRGGASAHNGVKLYWDGAIIPLSINSAATYIAMEKEDID